MFETLLVSRCKICTFLFLFIQRYRYNVWSFIYFYFFSFISFYSFLLVLFIEICSIDAAEFSSLCRFSYWIELTNLRQQRNNSEHQQKRNVIIEFKWFLKNTALVKPTISFFNLPFNYKETRSFLFVTRIFSFLFLCLLFSLFLFPIAFTDRFNIFSTNLL